MKITITPEQALAPIRASAVAEINSLVASVRSRIITELPGQQMVYLRKETEARAWVADPTPDLANYPLLAAEVGITAPDADQLAQIWLNQAWLWAEVLAPALERLRMTANGAVQAARNASEIWAAVGQVKQTLEAAPWR